MTGKTDSDTINIEVKIHAPIKSVWNAWTDPDLILKWFGSDPGGEGLSADIGLRPGGTFEISFRGSEGISHTCFGVYKEVCEIPSEPLKLISNVPPGLRPISALNPSPPGSDPNHLRIRSGSVQAFQTRLMGAWILTSMFMVSLSVF